MEVKCVPTRELFAKATDGYRVLSCELCEERDDIELNKYGNFTLSGGNLDDLQLHQEANIIIEKDEGGKYAGSYILTGYVGINITDGKIHVDEKYTKEILSRMMEQIQAERCLEAYPDFIDLILNGREDELDPKNIFNVGRKRLDEYIAKVKNCKAILFYPQAVAAGIINSNDIQKIKAEYATPELFESAMAENPYKVYMNVVGFSFNKSDKLVCSRWPDFVDSEIRCEYGCVEILKQNESLGDTKISANIMASAVHDLVPEAYHYIVDIVKNSELFHYDEKTKYVGLRTTYEAEQTIALNVLTRLNSPKRTPMKWKEYTKSGDQKLTDEQASLLKVVQDNSIAMLIGGAGNGKSFSMKAVIRMLEGNNYSYTMLAPTGTAAKVLTKATGRRAFTVHMFLASKMECGEFLVLEESSMLGVELLARLLDYIDEDTKILFICDPSQLPSISCGNIVHDILEADIVPTVRLTKIFRYNTSGLITIATDTRNGNAKSFKDTYDDYHYTEIDNGSLAQVVATYQELLDDGYSKQDILILVPYNKTQIGTYAINSAIQEKFNKKGYLPVSYVRESTEIKFKIGDRAINKKNNYHVPMLDMDDNSDRFILTNREMFVANGSIGVIRKHYKDNNADCFAIEFEEGIGEFKGSDIGHLLLGYAVTIHASQGNQSKAVIVVLDEKHKRMLNRNLMYVAFTRSQEQLRVIGDSNSIEEAMNIEATNERETWLGDMLKPVQKEAN